jgi:hypothetical protein
MVWIGFRLVCCQNQLGLQQLPALLWSRQGASSCRPPVSRPPHPQPIPPPRLALQEAAGQLRQLMQAKEDAEADTAAMAGRLADAVAELHRLQAVQQHAAARDSELSYKVRAGDPRPAFPPPPPPPPPPPHSPAARTRTRTRPKQAKCPSDCKGPQPSKGPQQTICT